MIEIRIHGRGGQGSVTAAYLLAMAAFEEGYYSQAFPHFGVERRGAPVEAYVRLSKKPIRLRERVYTPDMLIIQDPTLISPANVFKGVKQDGLVLINSDQPIKKPGFKIVTIPATKIALETIGRPIINTAMLGAFGKATGLISLKSINQAIKQNFNSELAKINIEATKIAYESL